MSDVSRTVQDSSLAAIFAGAMRAMASTVSIITATGLDGCRFGMTATSVTSVSMQPPSLLVCINSANASHEAVAESGRFCVNMLTDEQSQHCKVFSMPGDKTPYFNSESWSATDGLPCLLDAAAVITCRVANQFRHGSHGIFIGDVVSVSIGRGAVRPLVYLNKEIIPARPSMG